MSPYSSIGEIPFMSQRNLCEALALNVSLLSGSCLVLTWTHFLMQPFTKVSKEVEQRELS